MGHSVPKSQGHPSLRDLIFKFPPSFVHNFLLPIAESTPGLTVEGEGFEPSKALAGRFTVCSHWPLGHPSIFFCSADSEPTIGFEPMTY